MIALSLSTTNAAIFAGSFGTALDRPWADVDMLIVGAKPQARESNPSPEPLHTQ